MGDEEPYKLLREVKKDKKVNKQEKVKWDRSA
jgi:hypothetical protein